MQSLAKRKMLALWAKNNFLHEENIILHRNPWQGEPALGQEKAPQMGRFLNSTSGNAP
jgi:hypothetical protein